MSMPFELKKDSELLPNPVTPSPSTTSRRETPLQLFYFFLPPAFFLYPRLYPLYHHHHIKVPTSLHLSRSQPLILTGRDDRADAEIRKRRKENQHHRHRHYHDTSPPPPNGFTGKSDPVLIVFVPILDVFYTFYLLPT